MSKNPDPSFASRKNWLTPLQRATAWRRFEAAVSRSRTALDRVLAAEDIEERLARHTNPAGVVLSAVFAVDLGSRPLASTQALRVGLGRVGEVVVGAIETPIWDAESAWIAANLARSALRRYTPTPTQCPTPRAAVHRRLAELGRDAREFCDRDLLAVAMHVHRLSEASLRRRIAATA